MKINKIQKFFLVLTLLGQGLFAGALDATIESFEKRPGYVEPIATFMGTLQNSGWFSSAKVSEQPGWSIGLPISFAFLQKDDQFYDYTWNTGCTDICIPTTSSARVPTIFGVKTNQQITTYKEDPQNLAFSTTRRTADDGFLADYSVLPILHFEAGYSQKYFEYKLRFLPSLSSILTPLLNDNNKLGYWDFGLGVNHDLGHYFKDKDLPVDFSATLNYTLWKMDFTPGKDYTGELNVTGHVSKVGILVGKSFGDVELLLNVGYEMSVMNSGGALVKLGDTVEENENIKPNLSIDGNNGFTVGLNFVGHWGYDLVIGGNYGAQGSTTLNILQYKSKELENE